MGYGAWPPSMMTCGMRSTVAGVNVDALSVNLPDERLCIISRKHLGSSASIKIPYKSASGPLIHSTDPASFHAANP